MKLIYITTQHAEEAKTIASTLLQKKLIACANILPKMQSLYTWEGEVKEAQEAVLILKLAENKVEEVVRQVGVLHSYDTPCVMVLPVEGGSAGFLEWVGG